MRATHRAGGWPWPLLPTGVISLPSRVPFDSISPNFFEVVGTPLLRGRSFTDADRDGTTPVVIVNETMAKRFWPGEDPVGKRIKYGNVEGESPWLTIVGVVGDMRRTGFDESVRCETFLPLAQNPAWRLTIVARAAAWAFRSRNSALPRPRAIV